MGKVALITGAGSGIGRQSALALARAGYQVAVTGRRADRLDETVKLMPAGADSLSIPCDVTKEDEVAELFSTVTAQFGRLDVLFNNAGSGTPPIPIEDLSLKAWQNVVDVNLTATFLCTREAIRMMKAQDPMGGRIINNGSISAHVPRPNSAPYTATKHGVTGLTRSTSLDGRKYNIVCSQIDIGNALTEMTQRMGDGALQADGEIAPEPTMDVEHVGDAIVNIANLPLSANVQFMTIMASNMPFIGRG